MNTQDSNNLDPFESANNAKPQIKYFFGINFFDMYHCILEKGGPNKGKPPFDPNLHKPEQMRTSINLSIVPLTGSKAKFPIERNFIADFPNGDWQTIVLPSIHALNLTPRDLVGKAVKVELVPSGSYVNNKGETKPLSVPKYLEVYPDEASCQAASDAHFNNNHTEQQEEAFPAKNPNGNDAEKAIALKFLPALITQAGKDPEKVAELLASNNLVGKYFNLNSQEVIDLITA